MNLFHSKVIGDPTCGSGPETVVHVLCECKKVWSYSKLCHVIEGQGEFIDILQKIVMNPSIDSNSIDDCLECMEK